MHGIHFHPCYPTKVSENTAYMWGLCTIRNKAIQGTTVYEINQLYDNYSTEKSFDL